MMVFNFCASFVVDGSGGVLGSPYLGSAADLYQNYSLAQTNQ
jgi:hypothetical protein